MGAVYAAVDHATGERVALKRMRPGNHARMARFRREFRVVADLSHPNLVQAYELHFERGEWFIVMELIEGGDLGRSLSTAGPTLSTDDVAALAAAEPDEPASPPLDEPAARHVLTEVAMGLAYLHGSGVVHGDLKPANILQEDTGRICLADFGLALAPHLGSSPPRAGTVGYLAPELEQAHGKTPETDLYALGATLFHLLTGHHPARGAVGEALRPALAALGVSGEVLELCVELCAENPSARPGPAAILARLGQSPVATTHAATLGLVGREDELAILRRALERSASGEAALIRVSGPSGVGKSALVDVATRAATQRGAAVLQARCSARERTPYAGLDGILEPLLQPSDACDPGLPALSHLFSSPPGADGHSHRSAAFGSVARLVTERARRQPIIVVVDDAESMTPDGAALLRHIAAGAPQRLALVLIGRGDRQAADEWQAVFGPRDDVLDLEVRPLARRHIRRLLRQRGVTSPAPTLLDSIAGNPLLARFAFPELAERRPLEAVLTHQLTTLVPEERAVLEIAGVGLEPVDFELLQRVERSPPRRLRRSLAALREAGLVRTVRTGGRPAFEPSHGEVRRAVLAALLPERAKELHRRMADALERRGATARLLVFHWTEAGIPERRRTYLRPAAEAAEACAELAAAGRLYAAWARETRPADHLQVLERAGDLLRTGGCPAEAADAYLEVVDHLGPRPESGRLLRLLGHLGETQLFSRAVAASEATYERGWRHLGYSVHRSRLRRATALAGLALGAMLPAASREVAEAELLFHESVVRAYLPRRPGWALEAALRLDRLARAGGGGATLIRGRAMRELLATLVGSLRPSALRRRRRRLAAMREDAEIDADPRARLVVKMADAVCSLAPTPNVAVEALRENRLAAERAGLGSAPEAGMNTVVELLVSWIAGRLSHVSRLARDTLVRQPLDWVTELMALLLACGPDLARARSDPLFEHFERVRAVCDPLPSSFVVDIVRHGVEGSLQLASGRFAAAAASMDRGFRVIDRPGLRGGLMWTAAAEPPLMAAVGLAARSELAPRPRRRALTLAARLARSPIVSVQASAGAARAALLWLAGHREQARLAAGQAVALCPTTDPMRRWRCLTVATRTGNLNPAWPRERDAIAAEHSFRALELEW